MNGYVLLDSKEVLRREAIPIRFLRSNANAKLVIAEEHFHDQIGPYWNGPIEVTSHETGLVLALDKDGQHCGTYRI